MKPRTFGPLIALLISSLSQLAGAQMMPGVGYQTSLSTNSHDVSGTVTIVDADTLLVEDFTFDGLGVSVFFYLATSDTTFIDGLPVGPQLVGTSFDGTEGPFTIDLPAGMTVDGYNAISVWCVAANLSFGDGTFSPPTPILGDLNNDGVVDFSDVGPFIELLISGEFQAEADFDQDSAVTFTDIPLFVRALSSQ